MLYKIYKINWLFIFLTIILSCIGFIALYSAAGASLEPWAIKQIYRFSFSLFILFFIALIDIQFWYKHCYTFFVLSIILLLGVEIFGYGLGSKRWIKIFGLNIQPSELVKVTLILALARYYHELKFERIGQIRNLLLPLIFILIPVGLILLQPDLGTSITVLFLGVTILFAAGVRLWKFILSFTLSVISLPIIWSFLLKEYQQKRILSFLNPESDPLGSGYHLIQSKIALGSGGIYGKGFLNGSQAYLNFLPEKQTDFIFTMIGEEFGFIGIIFILSLYSLMIIICFYIAFQSFSTFGRILSIGVGTNLFLYVILNTAMVVGLLPVVGIPLPLLSYGGTVMISIMISFGFLINVKVHQQEKNF